MQVIPAIDIRGGRCVRLYQGDYSRETVFSEDPVATARRWEAEGARRLHVVDLDGAARGEPVNLDVVSAMAREVHAEIQMGGGVRRMETLERVLERGAGRVVLGTIAVEHEELLREACRRFGEAIVVSVDARDGHVATRAWRERTSVRATELVERIADLGARRVIYTDIARDGSLAGPNLDAIGELAAGTSLPVLASGGVGRLEHLRQLRELGVEGVIVGRALYTGEVGLGEALAVGGGGRRQGDRGGPPGGCARLWMAMARMRVVKDIRIEGSDVKALFDTGSLRTYVVRDLLEGVPIRPLSQPYPVGLGGEVVEVTEYCAVEGSIEGYAFDTDAVPIHGLGRVDGEEIQALIGALTMEKWEIRVSPSDGSLDLSGLKRREFREL